MSRKRQVRNQSVAPLKASVQPRPEADEETPVETASESPQSPETHEEVTTSEVKDETATEASESGSAVSGSTSEEASSPNETVADPVDPITQARETYSLPGSWSDSEVEALLQWIEENPNQPVQTDEYFTFDPTRSHRELANWDTEELIVWMMGRLANPSPASSDAIVNEYRRRERLEPAWSTQDVLVYFRQNIQPKKTEAGVWITDEQRKTKAPEQWSDAELKAWLTGQIAATDKSPDTRLALEAKKRYTLVVTNGHDVTAVKDAYQASLLPAIQQPTSRLIDDSDQGSLTAMNTSFIDGNLQRYAKAVPPRALITETQGAKAQQLLEDTFQYLLRLEPKAMVEGLNKIRDFVKTHRSDLFSADYAMRFVHLVKGNDAVRRRHANTIELFRIVTDPNPALRKQIDIRRMLKDYSSPANEKLYDYFTNYA